MPKRGGCPFCSIASGKMDSPIIYQDEKAIATLDIKPANPGHMIVFPKKHYEVLFQMPQQEFLHVFGVVRAVTVALLHTVTPKGVNLLTKSGAAAGARVPHASVHIIPREKEDEVDIRWNPLEMSREELSSIRREIRSYFKSKQKALKKVGSQGRKLRKGRTKEAKKPKRRSPKRRKSKKQPREQEKERETSEELEEYERFIP